MHKHPWIYSIDTNCKSSRGNISKQYIQQCYATITWQQLHQKHFTSLTTVYRTSHVSILWVPMHRELCWQMTRCLLHILVKCSNYNWQLTDQHVHVTLSKLCQRSRLDHESHEITGRAMKVKIFNSSMRQSYFMTEKMLWKYRTATSGTVTQRC